MKLLKLAERFVSILSLLLFGALTGFSLFYTVYYTTDYQELPKVKSDCLPLVLLVCLGMVLLVHLVSEWILKKEEMQEKRVRLLLGAVLMYTLLFGVVWVTIAHCVPVGDQAYVCWSAEGFRNGDYSMLTLESYEKYLYIHPHQLGLAAWIELVYAIFGNDNYRAFQYLNCVGAVVTVYSGYRITGVLSEKVRTRIWYLFLAAGCFPMLFFVTFVYGEIPSIACSSLAVWFFLESCKKKSWKWFVACDIAICLAYLIRNNSLIILIAIMGVLVLTAVCRKKWRPLVLSAVLVLSMMGSKWMLHTVYEKRAGFELNEGAPMVLYLAMGMQEGFMAPGWTNGYILHNYWGESDFDEELSSQLAVEEIKKSLETFANDPGYMAQFYLEKFTSQWNDPTYQCFMMTNANDAPRGSLSNSMYDGKLQVLITWFMNQYHSLIFAGGFLSVIYLFWKKKPLEHQILLIVVLGGFLFHMIWEAKGRYILPYFVMILPMAAIGLEETGHRMWLWIRKCCTKGKV